MRAVAALLEPAHEAAAPAPAPCCCATSRWASAGGWQYDQHGCQSVRSAWMQGSPPIVAVRLPLGAALPPPPPLPSRVCPPGCACRAGSPWRCPPARGLRWSLQSAAPRAPALAAATWGSAAAAALATRPSPCGSAPGRAGECGPTSCCPRGRCSATMPENTSAMQRRSDG